MKTALPGLLEVPVVLENAGGDPLSVVDVTGPLLFKKVLANERENIFGRRTVNPLSTVATFWQLFSVPSQRRN